MKIEPKVFEEDNYLFLKNFLEESSCAALTSELRRLVEDGHTERDVQCPLSEAVTDTIAFDSLLEQLLPYFEKASGKELLPTYAYARLYSTGEELKLHTDRPACEISATLTLGFSGESWPFYVADKVESGSGEPHLSQDGETWNLANITKINMGVGDAVMYKGEKKAHWRNKFEGQWQAQVFLHYVDANGPNKSHKYDGRAALSHHKIDESSEEILYWHFDDALSINSCKKIITSAEKYPTEKALVGMNGEGTENLNVRDVNKIVFPSYRGIGATMAGMGISANSRAWQFNITNSNQTEYLKYDKHGHYLPHIDTLIGAKNTEERKLTVLAFLNEDYEGGRFFLQKSEDRIYPPQNAGTVLVFPSFVLHGVEPVTKGIRRSIVTWLVGPPFK